MAAHPDQDREFELVLGNKQLFSLLFLVFVLLGVFFAMGYVMGRNTGTSEVARQPAPRSGEEAPTADRPAATGPAQSALPPTIPAPEATRQGDTPATSAAAPAREEPATPRLIDPKPGQVFLQVSAVARPEAELLAEVLIRKGFDAAMAPGPTDNLIRVLVGPVPNDSELTKVRAELEQSGFKPMVRRY